MDSKGMIRNPGYRETSIRLIHKWNMFENEILNQDDDMSHNRESGSSFIATPMGNVDKAHRVKSMKTITYIQVACSENPKKDVDVAHSQDVQSDIPIIQNLIAPNQKPVHEEKIEHDMDRIMRRTYQARRSLFESDCHSYQKHLQNLGETIYKIHQRFMDISRGMYDELLALNDWYSKRALIFHKPNEFLFDPSYQIV